MVCHPSKAGVWSSIAGACREYLGLDRIHLPSRLDRETSGVVVIAKDHATGARLHNAVTRGRFRKAYLAILSGTLAESCTVDAPLARDVHAEYSIRQAVVAQGGRSAVTEFEPISHGNAFTLVRAIPRTGRTHQIRVHAAHMGHPIVGDKLYGPDARFMLEFVHHGFTPAMQELLILDRQALHAAELAFCFGNEENIYRAPLSTDLADFCKKHSLALPLE